METTSNIALLKQKIIKTDTVLQMYLKSMNELNKMKEINKKNVSKLSLNKTELDKIKFDKDRMTLNYVEMQKKYKPLETKYVEIERKYTELQEEYWKKMSEWQLKYQTTHQELDSQKKLIENNNNKMKLEEMKSKTENFDRIKRENVQLKLEITELKNKIIITESKIENKQKEFNLKVIKKQEKIDSLKEQLKNEKVEKKIQENRVVECEDLINGLKLEISMLEMRKREECLIEEQDILTRKVGEVEEKTEENKEIKQSEESLKNENFKLQVRISELEKTATSEEKFSRENFRLKEELNELNKITRDLQEKNSVTLLEIKDSLKEEIKRRERFEEENTKLKLKIDKLMEEIQSLTKVKEIPFENENFSIEFKETGKNSNEPSNQLIEDIFKKMKLPKMISPLFFQEKQQKPKIDYEKIRKSKMKKIRRKTKLLKILKSKKNNTNFNFIIKPEITLTNNLIKLKNNNKMEHLDCKNCINNNDKVLLKENGDLLGFFNIKRENVDNGILDFVNNLIGSQLSEDNSMFKSKIDEELDVNTFRMIQNTVNQRSPMKINKNSLRNHRKTTKRKCNKNIQEVENLSNKKEFDETEEKVDLFINEQSEVTILNKKSGKVCEKIDVHLHNLKENQLKTPETFVENNEETEKCPEIIENNQPNIAKIRVKTPEKINSERRVSRRLINKNKKTNKSRLFKNLKNLKRKNKNQKISSVPIKNSYTANVNDKIKILQTGNNENCPSTDNLKENDDKNLTKTDLEKNIIDNNNEPVKSLKRPCASRRQSRRLSEKLMKTSQKLEETSVYNLLKICQSQKIVENTRIIENNKNVLETRTKNEVINSNDNKVIEIKKEKPKPLEITKIDLLFSKLINFTDNEEIITEIVEEFSGQDSSYVAQAILAVICGDSDKSDLQSTSRNAPILTVIQKTMLGFMLSLEKNNAIPNILENFQNAIELRVLTNPQLNEIQQIARIYTSICKLKNQLYRLRRFCCEVFYFCNDLAVPFFFIVLTLWSDVLPNRKLVEEENLFAKVMVQIILMKQCNIPGYNLKPLRDLLVFYGWPVERWDSNEVFNQIYCQYLNSPGKPAEFLLLLFCKNHPEKWVNGKIEEIFKPIVENAKNENFKATVIILIGNLISQFNSNSNGTDYLNEIKNWMKSLNTEKTSLVVRQSILLCLRRLNKK